MTTAEYLPRFADKVVIVTGGGGGIGTAIAQRFAREGAQVIVTDSNNEGATETTKLITSEGLQATTIVADISIGSACRDLVSVVIEKFGKIDVLVNNAGINRRGPLLELTEEDWDLTMAVNVTSMFHLCQAAIPHMIKAGGGAIVNTASQWGLHPAPGHIAYNVSKAAVASFTQNLARDYAPNKIRVNAVCPGEIGTPMLQKAAERKGLTFADFDKMVPFGRIGRPEEVASLVAFLASNEAEFMCGSLVEITGAQPVA
jgi:NAD(P)-dependent dehydrogenase (short-subunit alcohol dehydrogenase family)